MGVDSKVATSTPEVDGMNAVDVATLEDVGEVIILEVVVIMFNHSSANVKIAHSLLYPMVK